ncbi:MAG: alkyldihydroxyacetonephosphate synthase [Solirubrobacteraceae bacterium]|jgi:alkyldihydroxyacetonephosphate synthase|nr:alkyldihydroxyacetonephosphate synthase [Solirubrobacteraceae bacterium]
MVWWGWGTAQAPRELPDHARAFLADEIGAANVAGRGPVALADVRLSDSQLSETARATLAKALRDPERLRVDRAARVEHAAGRGYPDLVRLRAGDASSAPDAVLEPDCDEEVAAALRACAEADVAVVPFGGGTSVVGGVEPLRGEHSAVVALDLGRLDRLVSLDERSLTAVLEAGLRGPEAERLLNARGLTLGHFPQSYEHASIGGYVATRSAGQASTGYGRIDELVLGLRMVAVGGELDLAARPASAAGPDLRELVVGSEGTLGVITRASLKVRPRPAHARYEGWFFRSWAEGCEALRALEQARAAPDVARLSDEEETRLSLALAGDGASARVGGAYLRLRRYAGGCLGVTGWEGDREAVARRRARGARLLRRAGGLALGSSPGAAWANGRYAGPYLRDALLEHGVMVETLETATQWSNLQALYGAVRTALRDALSARGTPPLVLCHVSHLYPSGASLYFTFLAQQQAGAELEQWGAAKRAASDAIVAAGGTITHHHAVGRDHREWMGAEVGEAGLEMLRALKARMDPSGILNPGKLLP